jgi:serine/threonine-protein kinase
MIGKTLGQYEIESSLGAGGMGEVYCARDTRLGRRVAIKLLPEAFAGDRDRAARFEREARSLAALNHPHVAILYGFEESGGAYFLAMELIEGETLSERIASGPIHADEALRIAQEIAEALEAAHEKGIIHRDLKPGNIKITAEGAVKVLDFGLAKALDSTAGAMTLSNSPTAMDSGAASGIILGTAGYMSPEQAKGRPADTRSDIFSFGCVLYEMLTGARPFPGDSFPEVIAGVIAREPDLTKLPVNLNPRLLELLRRCLDKDPRRRWHAVADVRLEIAAIRADPQGALVQAQPARRHSTRSRAAVMAGLLLGAAISVPAVWFYKSVPAKAVTRFTFDLARTNNKSFTNFGRQFLAISPDGSQFVYTAGGALQLKPLGELDPITIQGPQGNVINPVFSPDGQSIVFYSPGDQALKRVPTAGGAPGTLCPVESNVFGMSWGAGDQILFGQPKGILRVSANAGKAEMLIPAENGELLQGPQLLPDGKTILFTSSNGSAWDTAKAVVQTPGSKDRKVLVEGAVDARYLPTGHLVYFLGGNVLAVPFDVKMLSVYSHPVQVVEGVRFSNPGTSGSAQFSVSNNGTFIYAEGPVQAAQSSTQGGLDVTLVDQNGSPSPTTLLPNNYASVRMAPNGNQVALGTDDGKEANIWIYDLANKAAIRQLTFEGRNLYPLWSGDSQYILYQSNREGDMAIFWQRADGTGTAERLTKPEKNAVHMPESWLTGAKDAQKFSFRLTSGGHDAIWLYSIPEKKATPLIANPGFDQNASAFSPDGKWIAYESDGPGSPGLFVQPYPTAGGAKYLIDGGTATAVGRHGYFPTWSPDSKEMYFHRAGNGAMHGVRIQTQPAFTASPPSDLPARNFVYDPKIRKYDITPNGKQFVMLFNPQSSAGNNTASALPQEIRVVLNWFEELKRLSPVK